MCIEWQVERERERERTHYFPILNLCIVLTDLEAAQTHKSGILGNIKFSF